MANAIYPLAKEALIKGLVDWPTDTIRIALVRNYTYNAAHQMLSDLLTAGGVVITSQLIPNKTATLGVADADDGTMGSPPAGPAGTSIIIYTDTGLNTSSRLLFFYDTATGLPLTPNGQAVTFTFDNGANKVFSLT